MSPLPLVPFPARDGVDPAGGAVEPRGPATTGTRLNRSIRTPHDREDVLPVLGAVSVLRTVKGPLDIPLRVIPVNAKSLCHQFVGTVDHTTCRINGILKLHDGEVDLSQNVIPCTRIT